LKNMTMDLSSTDDIPPIAEMLDELPKGHSLLLYDASKVPVDSQMSARGTEVTGE
jgi:hypothetical protein